MSKILYIAGYGRSGSTLLDILLGNHSEITGVGEATYLLDDHARSTRNCSCGKPYGECTFWKDLFPYGCPTSELAQLVRKVEKLSFTTRLLLGLITQKDRDAYRAYQARLFGHVISRTGKARGVAHLPDRTQHSKDVRAKLITRTECERMSGVRR